MRCPTCGYETEVVEEYVCSNCGYIIQREPIERIPIFARREEKWYKPQSTLKRIYNVITNPAKAFWDINHKKQDKGPLLIKIFMAITLGLLGFAIHLHVNVGSYNPGGSAFPWGRALQGIPVFLVYFLLGIVYYYLLFWFYNFCFSLAANFSVRLDDTLRIRYNVFEEGFRMLDVLSGKRLREEMQQTKQGPTMESVKEKGEMLTKIKQTGKPEMMYYAYSPLILINLVSSIIALVALPTASVSSGGNYSAMLTALNTITSSGVWGVIDALNLFTLAFWIPITMSLAMREIGNTNTTKLLIGNIIMGVILAYVLYFLRPTLGWNLNLIETFA